MQPANKIVEVPPEPHMPSLVQKLAQVMALVKHVPKNGRNSAQNYSYATEADIVDSVREHLAQRGVMLIPSVTKTKWRSVQGKHGAIPVVTLTVQFTVTDGYQGINFTVVGEGMDSGDKAVYKAMTGAEKYAVLKLFLIPTGDDPEKEDRKEEKQPSGGMEEVKRKVLEQAQSKAAETTPTPPPAAPRKSGASDFVVPFGKHKGKQLGEIEDDSYVTWLGKSFVDALNDPAKARYHDNTRKQLRAVIEEMNAREMGIDAGWLSLAGSEDVPF